MIDPDECIETEPALLEHPAAKDSVHARLSGPERNCSIEELCAFWFSTDIQIKIEGAAKLVSDPGLPGRLRGAFGAQLLEGASQEAAAGNPCPWSPPCAFDMLFRKQGRMERGFDYPGPWVMLLDVSGRDLTVTLRLFGFAGDYAAPAAEALVTAIRARLDLPGKSGLFVPDRRVTGRRVNARGQIQVQQGVTEAELEFLTPVALSGTSPLEHPASLISTMAFRAAGLARWHDSRLMIDRPRLHGIIDAVRFEWNGAQGVSWQRGSSRQGKAIPMSGYVGRLSVFGPPEAMNGLLPILGVGEEAFIGADAAFGCGRFVLKLGDRG